MPPWFLLLLYSVLIAFASLAGGWLPSLIQLTHLRKQLLMSFVSGVMLGVALLHMMPLALEQLPSGSWVGGSLMAGLLVMFFLIRVFHVHPHDVGVPSHDHPCDHSHDDHSHDDYADDGHSHHSHTHDDPTDHDHEASPAPVGDAASTKATKGSTGGGKYSLAGLLIGLTMHSLLDGVALAVSMRAELLEGHGGQTLLALGAFFAIFLHKPLDALAITSVMFAGRWSPRARGLTNAVFALTCPVGAVLFFLGAEFLSGVGAGFTGAALAFSAGVFLCIALADLLPEVAFHTHDRGKLSFALLLGVALACGVESMHSHDGHSHSATGPAHDHTGHDHTGHDHTADEDVGAQQGNEQEAADPSPP